MAFALRTNNYDLWKETSQEALVCFCIAAKHRKEDLGGGSAWLYGYGVYISLCQLEWMESHKHPMMAAIKSDMNCILEEEAECFFGYFGQQTSKSTSKANFAALNRRFQELPFSLSATSKLERTMEAAGPRGGKHSAALMGREVPIEDAAAPANNETKLAVRAKLLQMVDEVAGPGMAYGRSWYKPARYKANAAEWYVHDTADNRHLPLDDRQGRCGRVEDGP